MLVVMTCQQLSEKGLLVTACGLPLSHLKVLLSAHRGQGFHVALQCGPPSVELLVQRVTAPGCLWQGVYHSPLTVCVLALVLTARNLKPILFDLRGI